MRTGVVELPEHDESLARRVLLEAQFLGIDGFLFAVKVQAYRNLEEGTDWEGTDEFAATDFDATYGGLEGAPRRVLPARFYGACCRRRRRRSGASSR